MSGPAPNAAYERRAAASFSLGANTTRRLRPRVIAGKPARQVRTGTERAGFEPAMEREPHTRLAGECLQPLGHLSGVRRQCTDGPWDHLGHRARVRVVLEQRARA